MSVKTIVNAIWEDVDRKDRLEHLKSIEERFQSEASTLRQSDAVPQTDRLEMLEQQIVSLAKRVKTLEQLRVSDAWSRIE